MNQKRKKENARRVLSDHKRSKQKLVPPLMQHGPLKELGWHESMLPDFLWIAAMMGRRSAWKDVYSALNVLDRFVPEGNQILDGRISSFELVPESMRQEARAAIQSQAPHGAPNRLANAFGLLPSCPVNWLFEDWLDRNTPDPEIGLPILRDLIAENRDKSGTSSSRLRMAAIARYVKHGRFVHTGGGTFDLVPRYPGGLTSSEQLQVESVMRASWSSLYGSMEASGAADSAWPSAFWQECRSLVNCETPNHDQSGVLQVSGGDGILDPEPFISTSEMRTILQAVDGAAETLRTKQLAAFKTSKNDDKAEVLFGMASRTFRIFCEFLERPSTWAPATSGLFLRQIVDTQIVSAWLIHKDDPAMFAAYREHGLGRLKLLQAHINADIDDKSGVEVKEFLQALDARVNLERDAWFQPVHLADFAKISMREMAIDADLKLEYDLKYAPLSSENHGEWPSVRDHDTQVCVEPLHGNHRVGAFRRPSHHLSPRIVTALFASVESTISAIFESFQIDVTSTLAELESAIDSALYEQPSDDADDGPIDGEQA